MLLGNERANSFWAANVPPSEALTPSSCSEERRRFITNKYRQGKYRKYHPLFGNQRELNNVSWSHSFYWVLLSVLPRCSDLNPTHCSFLIYKDLICRTSMENLFVNIPVGTTGFCTLSNWDGWFSSAVWLMCVNMVTSFICLLLLLLNVLLTVPHNISSS